MCWGVIGRVEEVKDEFVVTVDFGGVKREAIVGVEALSAGDYVLVHAGVVISKLSEEDVLVNMSLYRDLVYQQFLDAGMGEGEARRRAEEEVGRLARSLGIDPKRIPSMGVEGVEARGRSEPEIPPNAFRRRYRIPLSDTDYLQVMHYTNYFRYCERAQQELLSEIGFSYSELIHRYGLFIPTVESGGKFKAPVRLDNEIEVAVWVEEVGRKHIRWRYIITNLTSQRVVGECYTVSVCTDTTLMESMELPEELKRRLRKYVWKPEGEK